MGQILVLDFDTFFPVLPADPQKRSTFLQTRAYLAQKPPSDFTIRLQTHLLTRFDRIVFFSTSDQPAVLRPHLLRWLKHHLPIFVNEQDLQVFRRHEDKGRWCRDHQVTHVVGDTVEGLAEIVLTSPHTIVWCLSLERFKAARVLQIVMHRQGLSDIGEFHPIERWGEFLSRLSFPA